MTYWATEIMEHDSMYISQLSYSTGRDNAMHYLDKVVIHQPMNFD